MSIKQLKKITLYGPAVDKAEVLSGLQEMGCVHLIPLTENTPAIESSANEPLAAKEAHSYLVSCPIKRREIRSFDEISADELVCKVIENKDQLRSASDHRDDLIKRIQQVRPWGNFDFPKLDCLAGMRLWFYVMPLREMSALDDIEQPWELVASDNKFAYVVVVSEKEPDANLFPVKRSRIGQHSLTELEQMLEQAEMKVEDVQAEREGLTRWTYALGQIVARKLDEKSAEEASYSAMDNEEFFLVSGWIPTDEVEQAKEFVGHYGVAAMFEEPTLEELPPTLLENSELVAGGSEAMAFYQLPSYRSWDPTTVLFFSFALFWAMIMNDAAYSTVLAGVLLIFRKKLSASQVGIRIRNMSWFVVGFGVLWGIGSGSYFGHTPSPDSLLGGLHFINMNNANAMMELSIVIGSIHVVMANLITAWGNRTRLYALAPIGWAIGITGGVLAWLGYMETVPMTFKTSIGPAMLIVGLALVFLFTSTRKVKSVKDLVLRIVDGLGAMYNISGAFGDILSYMRLFALGLASSSLAATFNGLAMDVLHSMPGIGIIFCGLILLAGHLLNIVLSLVSGVVHGLRLNLIEFFKWGLSEEGYPFKPFKKQED